jgi:hypothetical protein
MARRKVATAPISTAAPGGHAHDGEENQKQANGD